jgi:hypothetical protein
MWLIYFIVAIIIILLVLSKSGPGIKNGYKRIEVTVPNPEACRDTTMINYISRTGIEVLTQVFKKYNTVGLQVKPLFLHAFQAKQLGTFKLDYFLEQCEDYVPVEQSLYTNTITFEVAGVHVAGRKSYIRYNCNAEDNVDLVPEPRNRYDKNAIKIKHSNKLIGYVPAHENEEVAQIITQPHNAFISVIDDDGSFLDVEITVEYNT